MFFFRKDVFVSWNIAIQWICTGAKLPRFMFPNYIEHWPTPSACPSELRVHEPPCSCSCQLLEVLDAGSTYCVLGKPCFWFPSTQGRRNEWVGGRPQKRTWNRKETQRRSGRRPSFFKNRLLKKCNFCQLRNKRAGWREPKSFQLRTRAGVEHSYRACQNNCIFLSF